MSLKLIAMDLDGTVLRADQSIHPSLPDAFRLAHDRGIDLAIATGRAYQSTRQIAQGFGFRGPMICSNGAHVLSPEHDTIGAVFLDPEVQAAALRYAHENHIHVSAYGPEGVRTIRDSEWLAKYKLLVRGLDIPIVGLDALLAAELFKLVLICKADELASHRTYFSSFVAQDRAQLTESGPEYLEILPVDANKSNGLAKLAKFMRLDRNEIAAIGDYRNDLEMLSWVGFSGAVENALPEVKSIAQIVCKSNEEGGVAEFIERCILLNS